ncbi:hypothetical protein [Halomontanus rarus]|uniref:hypothetical protein n=1 Tax=Halomontanus rarus TaxID=3034020 RepID=UPI001F6224FA
MAEDERDPADDGAAVPDPDFDSDSRPNSDSDSDIDPTAIRSLAVAAEDVVDAFVYTRENPGTAVLRVTPPFHGRMRARLHVYRVDDTRSTGAIQCAPADLLPDDVVDAYPTVAETEARLADEDAGDRDDREGAEIDRERIREAHTDALEDWRGRARDSILDSVVLGSDDGTRVDVKPLG